MFSKFVYILSSFFAGFALMTLELVSTRLVAPIVGASVFTWTSVIGITLLGLSLGAFWGGVFADTYPQKRTLAIAFFTSGASVLGTPLLLKGADVFLKLADVSILLMVTLLSCYLFLIPAFFLGTIQPIILKLYADIFHNIGKEYGILSAAWSLGSILGVFSTGFLFVAILGSIETLYLVAGILFLLGIYFFFENKRKKVISTALLVVFLVGIFPKEMIGAPVLFQKESPYYLIQVVNTHIPVLETDARILFLDFDSHSIEYSNKDQEPISYISLAPLFKDIVPDASRIHVIGGGAYTFPERLAAEYPNADVVVSEVDKEVTKVAENFFSLDSSRIKTLLSDARVYFATHDEQYDIIFGDAFNSFISVPSHLVTQEFNESVKGHLSERGVYALNMIGAIDGDASLGFKSVLKTFAESFPEYYIFAFGKERAEPQNIVLMGVNGKESSREERKIVIENGAFKDFLVTDASSEGGLVLTDNFSPLENLMTPVMKSYFDTFVSFRDFVFRH